MNIVPQPVASGNEKALASGRNQLYEQPKRSNGLPDFDAGYRLLEPHEIDPNAGEWPPDFKDEYQAALNACLRGFDVIPLQSNGTPLDPNWQSDATSDPAIVRERWTSAPRCKVGAVTSGLVVVSVSGPEGLKQFAALNAREDSRTAGMLSRVGEGYSLFFRLPVGVRSPEEILPLAPDVDALPDAGHAELPSGAPNDICDWINRRLIAAAPQWLVDKLAALAASQTQGNDDMGAGAAAMEAFRNGQLNMPPPLIVADEQPETLRADNSDKRDTSETVPAKLSPATDAALIAPVVTKASAASADDENFSWIRSDDCPETPAAKHDAGKDASKPTGVSANTNLALGLLDDLDFNGRHDLVAIDPESGRTDCATFFFPNEREKARQWVDARQGKTNLYTSVNRARENAPRNKRLSGSTIASIRALVADIDIPKGGDSSGEHFRTLRAKLLKDVAPELAKLGRPPSIIVDSGGGLQLWWKLKEAIPATPENAALVDGIGRAINARIKEAFPEFKLDTVTDLPRVMRLPGTINIPDKKKRAEGRSAAPATVLMEHSCAASYTLDDLARAWPPIAKPQSSSSEEDWHPIAKELQDQWDVICAATCYDELPADLREKFESACKLDPALQDVWHGIPFGGQKDETPSGFAFALAERLVRAERFTVIEFGQLLWVCEDIYPDNDPAKVNPRQLSRAWGKKMAEHAKRSSASGLDDDSKRLAKAKSKSDESEHAKAQDKGDELDAPSTTEWEDPTDFWADESELPDLPDGVVPEIVERFARDRSRRLGVEAGAPAVCFVTSLAAAISARNDLQVRQKDPLWKVKAILWTAIIAPSGSNKSATLSYATAPVQALEKSFQKEYAAAKRLYDEQERVKKEKKGEPADPRQMELPKPVCRRKIIKDATVEGAALLLSKNRDGLFYACDELSSFLGRINSYKNRAGADRPYWLEAKEGGPYSQDRKTSDPIIVEHNAVSILGGIQPDKIKEQAQDMATDGLMQRFMPIYLKQHGAGEDDYPDEGLDKTIAELAIVISKAEPRRFKFASEADAERALIEDFAWKQRERSHGSKFQEWTGKLPNEFARLALAFHYIQWAALPGGQRGVSPPEMISLETATMARRFLIEFVCPHASEFYRSMLDRSASEDHATWIGGYVLSRKSSTITRREIQRSYKALKDPSKTGLLSHAMSVFEMHNWGRPIGFKRDGTPTTWRVNPRVHDGRFNEIAAKERAWRDTVRAAIACGPPRRAPTSDDR